MTGNRPEGGRLRVVDLCCGAGGWSEGLRQAGYEVTLAVDNWRLALDSHAANHPGAEHVLADVRDLAGSIGRADVVIGSPPCQAWSTARGGRGEAPDVSILEACLQIVDEARPRWWVLENVPRAAREFQDRGVPVRFIRASTFGLAHRRRRVFAGHYAPPLSTGVARERHHTPLASVYKVTQVSPAYDAPGDIRRVLGRAPTVAELKEMMGFPADYVILGSRENQGRQIGNAVCPPVARAIAEAQTRPAPQIPAGVAWS